MKSNRFILPIAFTLFIYFVPFYVQAQITIGSPQVSIDYDNPKEYEIGGITITGVQYLDASVLTMLTGLKIGDRIKVPGEEITLAIQKLWRQGLFDNVRIIAQRIEDNLIFLEIQLVERPRLSKFTFIGIKKGEADDLRDKLKLASGEVVTRSSLVRAEETIKKYFTDKGFLNVQVDIQEIRDTTKLNNVILKFTIDKKQKVKINEIIIHGNQQVKTSTIKNALKETKEKSAFRPLGGLDQLVWNTVKNAAKLDMAGLTDNFIDYYYTNLKLRIFKSSKFIRKILKPTRKIS